MTKPLPKPLLEQLRAAVAELGPSYGLQTLGVLAWDADTLELFADFGEAPTSLIGLVALEQALTDRLGVTVHLSEQPAAEAMMVWHAA
ncbi:MAG: hypothetical protein NZ482_06415 [Gloeomargarita sp. SKYG98]|nr:hypothetical protein [Gloeomargarita sp. SKYG98]